MYSIFSLSLLVSFPTNSFPNRHVNKRVWEAKPSFLLLYCCTEFLSLSFISHISKCLPNGSGKKQKTSIFPEFRLGMGLTCLFYQLKKRTFQKPLWVFSRRALCSSGEDRTSCTSTQACDTAVLEGIIIVWSNQPFIMQHYTPFLIILSRDERKVAELETESSWISLTFCIQLLKESGCWVLAHGELKQAI